MALYVPGGPTASVIEFQNAAVLSGPQSFTMWVRRRGSGAGNGDLIFQPGRPFLYHDTTSNRFIFQSTWSGGVGNWSIAETALDTWVHLAITYDDSAPANDPVFYVNGTPAALIDNSNPTGTVAPGSGLWRCYGSTGGSRSFQGEIARLSIFNVGLTAAQVASLAAGAPAFIIAPPVLNAELADDLNDDLSGPPNAYSITAGGFTDDGPPQLVNRTGRRR